MKKDFVKKTEAVRQTPVLAHKSALSGNLDEAEPVSASYLGRPSMLLDADMILLDHF